MRTLLIDTDRLGPVMLREAPRALERDGAPVANADGERVFLGRLIVPGGAKNIYTDVASPTQVRLKTVGSDRGLQPGPVRLGGRVTLTSWYVRQGRGKDAASELTVSAERIEPLTTSEPLHLAGWLPVKFMVPDGLAPLVLDQTPLPDGGFRVIVMLPSGSVEGLAEVTSAESVAHLVGRHIQCDLSARLVVPDREDIGRNAKAELPLTGANWAAFTDPKLPARGARDKADVVAGS